jgi:hypothetical protein
MKTWPASISVKSLESLAIEQANSAHVSNGKLIL